MPPPIPRCSGWVYSSLISPRRVSLPRKGGRVGLHIDLFEDCSAFTRVAACTLALSPNRDTLIEGFSHFVTSMTAPIASGRSESPGGPCTHWKAPPCHGAHPLRSSASDFRTAYRVAIWCLPYGAQLFSFAQPRPSLVMDNARLPNSRFGRRWSRRMIADGTRRRA